MIDGWYAFLNEEKSDQVLAGYKFLLKTRTSSFAPSLSELLGAIRKVQDQEPCSAAEAWASRGRCSPLARECWSRWGGDSRYGALPDPGYCGISIDAQKILGFAKKEFLDLYESMLNRREHAMLITHDHAKKQLKNLGLNGLSEKMQMPLPAADKKNAH